MNPVQIFARDVALLHEKFPEPKDFDAALKRVSSGEPLAYVLGEWYFYDQVYKVSPDCLVPRPETEHLVDYLIKTLPKNAALLDLCTGSGCIAISTLAHRPDCTALALDISSSALSLARENAELNGVADRIEFICDDLFTCNKFLPCMFDAIVSNPPYIKSSVIPTLDTEVLHEPIIALDGGEDGLDFYRFIISSYPRFLKTDGFLLFEIGYDQGEELKRLSTCRILKDYSGNDRVAIIEL